MGNVVNRSRFSQWLNTIVFAVMAVSKISLMAEAETFYSKSCCSTCTLIGHRRCYSVVIWLCIVIR